MLVNVHISGTSSGGARRHCFTTSCPLFFASQVDRRSGGSVASVDCSGVLAVDSSRGYIAEQLGDLFYQWVSGC